MIAAPRFLVLVTLLFGLVACTNQTTPIQYYLLHSPNDVLHTSSTEPATKIWLANVDVSDYLLQRGLALQTQENALHISTQHIWAEPFESGFTKLLTHHLAPEYQVVEFSQRNTAEYTLSVALLHLVATANGDVIITAQFRLTDQNQTTTQHYFSSRYSLQEDGYDHAVSVYRQAIESLALRIKDTFLTQ